MYCVKRITEPVKSRTFKQICFSGLTLKWRETHVFANCLGHLWFNKRLGALKATSLFLNQSWLRIECTMMKNFQSNIFQNSNAFIKINWFWSVRLLWTLKADGRLRVKNSGDISEACVTDFTVFNVCLLCLFHLCFYVFCSLYKIWYLINYTVHNYSSQILFLVYTLVIMCDTIMSIYCVEWCTVQIKYVFV